MKSDLPEGLSAHNKPKKNGPLWRGLRFMLSLFLLMAIVAAGMMEFLTLTEYRPEDREVVAIEPVGRELAGEGEALRVLTWNCGYGALGDNADFFMEGGKSVYTADEKRVRSNITSIAQTVAGLEPDVVFLQEVDRDSMRSRDVDEVITFYNVLLQHFDIEYTVAFAYNLDVRFIPFPIPPIGKVRSGLLTCSSAWAESAERIQLPNPFKWPLRLANFKRCLLVERLPLQNSDKELVLINLHLEAYDSGEGKAEQTRMLREILEEEAEKGNYVIAGGDFNQCFSNTDLTAYPQQEDTWAPGILDTAEIGEEWQCLMDSAVPSCRGLNKPYEGADHDTFQYYVVDGFIVSPNIEVKSCSTQDLGFVLSDHNPVLMECVLK